MSTTRRRFLQCAGAAAFVATGRGGFAQQAATTSAAATSSGRAQVLFELGIATYSFRKFSLEQTLAMSVRLGIKHLCLKSMHLPLDARAEAIAQALAKAKAADIDVYGCGVMDMDTPAQVEQSFVYAKAAAMRVIVAQPVPELLPLVDKKVQEYNIRVAIHNHGKGDIWPSPVDAYEKIKGLDRRIGLCIDIGHTVRNGDDLCRTTERVADRIFDVHVKDETEASMAGRPLEVGRGVIDIPRFFRTLAKLRYAGVVSFEYEKDADDPLPGLAESVGYVRGVLAAL